jgi:teichoic acid transport system permease protein
VSENLSQVAADHGLERVGARPPLGAYLVQVIRRLDFTLSLARFRIKSENERNRLGMLWVLLRPTFSALIYGTVFGFVLAGMRPENFVPYVVVGVFLLEFFNTSMNGGAKSIISNTALVQSLPFPRMVLPVAKVLENLLNFIPPLIMMLGIALLWGSTPSWSWLLLIPLMLLFWMFNQGVALVFARLTVHMRDLSQLTPFISRMIFYTAGVFYDPAKILSDHPRLTPIFDWHPLYEILAITRGLILDGYEVPVDYWWRFAIWSVGILVVGIVFFWKAEERYGREN